jgi:hypothetical protein
MYNRETTLEIVRDFVGMLSTTGWAATLIAAAVVVGRGEEEGGERGG